MTSFSKGHRYDHACQSFKPKISSILSLKRTKFTFFAIVFRLTKVKDYWYCPKPFESIVDIFTLGTNIGDRQLTKNDNQTQVTCDVTSSFASFL